MEVNQQSLLEKYLALYQKDKKSKVFAPLADIYRKLGMFEEAIKILKAGLKISPDYVLGNLNLALCYIDLGKFKLAYEMLRPFMDKNADNVALQKAFAEVCIKLSLWEEAVFHFEYLSFLCPKDDFYKQKILEIKAIKTKKDLPSRVLDTESSGPTEAQLAYNLEDTPIENDGVTDSWSLFNTSNSIQSDEFPEEEKTQFLETDKKANTKRRYQVFLKKIQEKSVSP